MRSRSASSTTVDCRPRRSRRSDGEAELGRDVRAPDLTPGALVAVVRICAEAAGQSGLPRVSISPETTGWRSTTASTASRVTQTARSRASGSPGGPARTGQANPSARGRRRGHIPRARRPGRGPFMRDASARQGARPRPSRRPPMEAARLADRRRSSTSTTSEVRPHRLVSTPPRSLEFHGSWRSPARSRARRLAARDPRGGSRPRGPVRDLPQHADHARDRGARPHPLQAGQDPRLVLHGPRQRGLVGRRRDRDGPRGRRHAAAPRHGRPRDARGRALADLRAVHGPRGRADAAAATGTSTWPTPTRPDRDGQPPPGDAAGRRRLPRSPSASATRSASRSPGTARAPPRAATRTRG